MSSRSDFEKLVMDYATTWIKNHVNIKYSSYSEEIRQEMEQESLIAILNKLPLLKKKDWKAYVQQRGSGAVKDYIKSGAGYEEEKKSIKDAKKRGDGEYIYSRFDVSSFSKRSKMSSDSTVEYTHSVDDLQWKMGNKTLLEWDPATKQTIRWDLLAHMSRVDRGLLYFTRWIRGSSFKKIGDDVGVCASAVGVHITAFIERFKDPEWANDPWMQQICYALDICDRVGIRDVDYSSVYGYPIGWNEIPVKLDGSLLDEPGDLNLEAPKYVG